jgi:hypothetical protein
MTELAAKDITVHELNALAATIRDKRREADEIEKEFKKKKRELEDLYKHAMIHFDALEIDKWSLKGVGTIYTDNRVQWTVPKGESREKLFAHLREIGRYEALITINSQTFNAYCNDELKQAIAAGNVDWQPPGTDEPNIQRSLRFRKG